MDKIHHLENSSRKKTECKLCDGVSKRGEGVGLNKFGVWQYI